MSSQKSLWLRILVVSAIMLPLFAYSSLNTRSSYLQHMADMYECEKDVCEADFNGDGVLGRVSIERMKNSADAGGAWLVVDDGGQELLRLPYEYLDNTLRTHVAVRKGTGNRSQLLIFDGTRGRRKVISAVYEWQSGSMVETSPAPIETEILTAMAAHDDVGTWLWWSLYRALALPLLLGYYVLLALAVIGLTLWQRSRLSTAHLQ